MKIRTISAVVAVASLFAAATSCTSDDLDLYSGVKAGIYIQEVGATDYYGNPVGYRNESKEFSFTEVSGSVMEGKMSFTVRLMGELADYDRPYKIAVDTEKSTAREGIDFDLSKNNFCIKAGEATDVVDVIFFRNENCRQKTLEIHLKLEPSEHFVIPFDLYRQNPNWSVDSDTLRSTTWKIRYGETYKAPSSWSTDYFGPWTVAKYIELNKLLDLSLNDWTMADKGIAGSKIGAGRMRYGANEFRKYLQKMADEGTPVLDDDGSYMQLGPQCEVNYSAYTNDSNT